MATKLWVKSLKRSIILRLNNYSTSSVDNAAETSHYKNRRKWQEEATLYVHWPYCEKRCTYCNFNKYINQNVDHSRMRRCLMKETSHLLKLSEVKRINSVFFGGGTPSLAEPQTFKAILDTVQSQTELKVDAEVTIEVNPTDVETQKLTAFKEAGVNRVSLGLQALNSVDLQLFGRNHSVEEGLKSLESCKQLFPGKTSVDVIFGRPNQTVESWEEELNKVLSVADDHISLYQLTLERGTALFKKVMDREVLMPSPDLMADLYEAAIKKLEAAGYHRYEASNFARSQSSESSHNKAYWAGSQYIGVGPGAHGRFTPFGSDSVTREARVQTLEPQPWMYEVDKYGHATRRAESQTDRQILEEIVMLGLRTSAGLSQERWSEFCDTVTLTHLFSDTYMVKVLIDEGYLELDQRGVRATSRGLNVVDSIIAELIAILDNHFTMET